MTTATTSIDIMGLQSAYANVHPEQLPSFPTRRSSDLSGGRGHRRARAPADRGRRNRLLGQRAARRRDQRGRAARSEEDTSELQSRPHLVCRLVLEKKKAAYANLHREQTTDYFMQCYHD